VDGPIALAARSGSSTNSTAKRRGISGGTREEDLHRRLHPSAGPGRPGDDQGTRPPAELTIQDQERQSAEVVSVQVGQEDPADLRRVHAGSLHRDQRRRAAVDEKSAVCVAQEKAGLEAPPASERVACPQELKPDLAQRAPPLR